MGKLLLITALLFALTSCKKEYTCNCYWETGKFVSTHKITAKKKEAEKKCNPYEFGYGGNFEGYCEIE